MKGKIIIVCGQTATGKSHRAIDLAREHDGVVISCDSRQIYKGLDKGSNKLSLSEREGVIHYGFDIATIGETYNVSQFQAYARSIIAKEAIKGKTIVLCGGTGLYIDAVMFERYKFPNNNEDKDTNDWGIWNEIKNFDITWIGLRSTRENLYKKISERAEKNFLDIEEEVKKLQRFHDNEWIENLGLEYRYMSQYIKGDIIRAVYVEEIMFKTYQYARRQITWFKRNSNIKWIDV